MRITFDSNAWEKLFDPSASRWAPILAALRDGRITGFISEAGFRIEAIRRSRRATYFAQPAMAVEVPLTIVLKDGKPYVHLMSIGPDDKKHPGLPDVQAEKLKTALAVGIRLLRGAAWLGLPSPHELRDQSLFAPTSGAENEREQRQIDILTRIESRGVGRALFHAVGGWKAANGAVQNEKMFAKACAEWADGELVAAHIAYRNDILCTNDLARGAGVSIFDQINRAWLLTEFGVRFATLDDVLNEVSNAPKATHKT
jgi:hypothetical protein